MTLLQTIVAFIGIGAIAFAWLVATGKAAH